MVRSRKLVHWDAKKSGSFCSKFSVEWNNFSLSLTGLTLALNFSLTLLAWHFWQAFEKLLRKISQGSKYDTAVNARVTQNSEHVWLWLHPHQECLNMPEWVLMCLSLSELGWILLNIPEYAWKYLNKLFWLCQVS